jgi:hypothetical protein
MDNQLYIGQQGTPYLSLANQRSRLVNTGIPL